MRDIVFRGLSKKYGKMAYGDLHTVNLLTIPEATKGKHIYGLMENNVRGNIEVYQETVGQFIGIKDSNGKMIFEGDIVAIKDTEKRAIVHWNSVQVRFEMRFSKEEAQEFYFGAWRDIEVIGNIHESLEVLGEGKCD